MSQTKTNATSVARRGVASARGVARKKFSVKDAQNNGLFLMHLDDVVLSTITIGADTSGLPSFNGMDIPKLTFTFASNEASAIDRKYTTLSFTAAESTPDNIPSGKNAWKVDSILDWLQHILNVYYFKGRELTEEEANLLALNIDDMDANGEYVPVEPESVIAAWTSLFENVVKILNSGKDGAPVYKTADGKPIVIWGKLLAATRTKKDWVNIQNGNLAFSTFVGEGRIEIYRQNTAPSLNINTYKESIQAKEIEKPKAPNSPMNGAAPFAGGFDAGMGGVPSGTEFAGMEENPF